MSKVGEILFRIRARIKMSIPLGGIRRYRVVFFCVGGAGTIVGGFVAVKTHNPQVHGVAVAIDQALEDYRAAVAANQAQTGSFSTRLGEHACKQLPDGILACLNTNTTLNYRYDGHSRHVEIASGEAAFFKVTQDLNRPFDVDGGGLTVGGLTGSFDVYRMPDSVQVTAIDGDVKVMPTASIGAAAGFGWTAAQTYHRFQQVKFDLTTNTLHVGRKLTESGLTQLMAWQRGRIDITSLTLRQALDQFKRYQPIGIFQFESESLAAIRMVDGELDATNLMGFLITVESVYKVHYNITVGPDGNAVVKLWRQREKATHSKEQPETESKAVAGVDWRES